MFDEGLLAQRLISYDTSRPEELLAAAGFVQGWLESRDVAVHRHDHRGLPVLVAEVGASSRVADATCVVLHGHIDVVPGKREQFEPCVQGDRLIGRGAYDMKGALAAMMCVLKDVEHQERVRVRLVCVPDEESDERDERSTDAIVKLGLGGDFAITGEPTNLHIGVQAKGVLVMSIEVHGRAAHSSTPWLGDNAVLKAVDVFRAIESLPFTRESSECFDRPSVNLGRIRGGEALNMVPDRCTMAVDVRHLPGQDPDAILAQVRGIEGIEVTRTFIHPPVSVPACQPFVRTLRDAVAGCVPEMEILSVARDGASDAAAFLTAGIPAVELGPAGAGHHGPAEWVSLSSLARYRRALGAFIRALATPLQEGPRELRPRPGEAAARRSVPAAIGAALR